jgi:hypothetical protein
MPHRRSKLDVPNKNPRFWFHGMNILAKKTFVADIIILVISPQKHLMGGNCTSHE